ncbi:MAG: proline--tRNA ligase [Candidatus Heimdallarchaeota archaeon]|nr:proline--tRNA ligase [Candidatus Heimdallarchaeota archaeon]
MKLPDKEKEFLQWYTAVIEYANIVDKRSPVKGSNVIMPYGYSIWESIVAKLDGELKATGHKNAYFPLFIPEDYLEKEAEHFEGFIPEVAWVTRAGDRELDRKLALRPTSETIMYEMFRLWIRSHVDLPLKINQWCNIIRFDTKETKPLLRDREFLWSEGHTCHATAKEAEEQVKESMRLYEAVYKESCMSYLIVRRPKYDTFAGAVYSIAYDCPLPDGRTLQIGTTHNLGQGFSKAFNITFQDKDKKNKNVHQTCYGLSTRLIAAIVGMHGDEKGLIIPPYIAPIQIVIVPIYRKEQREEVIKASENMLKKLLKAGLKVELDKREGYTPGWKFNEWEVRGVPIRLELGPRDIENDQVVLVRRDTGEKLSVPMKDTTKKAKEILREVHDFLQKRADKLLEDNISHPKNYEELIEIQKTKRGFSRVNWCGDEACAEKVKDETGADVRGTREDIKEKPDGDCIICGTKAKEVVYIASAY